MIWRCNYLVTKKIDCVDPMLGLAQKMTLTLHSAPRLRALARVVYNQACAQTEIGIQCIHSSHCMQLSKTRGRPELGDVSLKRSPHRAARALWHQSGLEGRGGGRGVGGVLKHLLVTDSLHNSLCHGGSVSLTALPAVMNV